MNSLWSRAQYTLTGRSGGVLSRDGVFLSRDTQVKLCRGGKTLASCLLTNVVFCGAPLLRQQTQQNRAEIDFMFFYLPSCGREKAALIGIHLRWQIFLINATELTRLRRWESTYSGPDTGKISRANVPGWSSFSILPFFTFPYQLFAVWQYVLIAPMHSHLLGHSFECSDGEKALACVLQGVMCCIHRSCDGLSPSHWNW